MTIHVLIVRVTIAVSNHPDGSLIIAPKYNIFYCLRTGGRNRTEASNGNKHLLLINSRGGGAVSMHPLSKHPSITPAKNNSGGGEEPYQNIPHRSIQVKHPLRSESGSVSRTEAPKCSTHCQATEGGGGCEELIRTAPPPRGCGTWRYGSLS